VVQKLFLEEPYLKECTATITKVDGNKIFLDQTVFFPEGGGQLGDQGWIEDYEIIDTQKIGGKQFFHKDFPVIKVGTEIVHTLKEPVKDLAEGMKVRAKINWERRHKLMRMHSAAHLVYYYVFETYGKMHVKGCRIAEDKARFDFFSPDRRLDREELDKVERLANSIVEANLPISNFPVEGEPEALVWVCGDMRIPCGGTHVRQTQDIGKISVKRNTRGRSIERVYLTIEDGN